MYRHSVTKSNAEKLFRLEILPLLRKRYDRKGHIDCAARRTAWNDYVDGLQKDGAISESQARRWTQPRWLCPRGR
jgi:hypothetical protein